MNLVDEKEYCPRRQECASGPFRYKPDGDKWEHRDGQSFRQCSYCGCIHPDDAAELLEKGWLLQPTDKGYKYYLKEPNGKGWAKLYTPHVSKEQGVALNEAIKNRT